MQAKLNLLASHLNDSNKDFMLFLRTFLPPQHREEEEWVSLLTQEAPTNRGDWRKLMMKSVGLYHPDKVDRNIYLDEYCALCEEITKVLGHRWPCIKTCNCHYQ